MLRIEYERYANCLRRARIIPNLLPSIRFTTIGRPPTIGSTIAFENHLSFVEIAGCSRQYEAMRRSAACILVFGAVLSAKFYTTPL